MTQQDLPSRYLRDIHHSSVWKVWQFVTLSFLVDTNLDPKTRLSDEQSWTETLAVLMQVSGAEAGRIVRNEDGHECASLRLGEPDEEAATRETDSIQQIIYIDGISYGIELTRTLYPEVAGLKDGELFQPFSDQEQRDVAAMSMQLPYVFGEPIPESEEEYLRHIGPFITAMMDHFYETIRAVFPGKEGHVDRMAALCVRFAEAINDAEKGPYANYCTSPAHLELIASAAKVHDIGKVFSGIFAVGVDTVGRQIADRIDRLEREGYFRGSELPPHILEKTNVSGRVSQRFFDQGGSLSEAVRIYLSRYETDAEALTQVVAGHMFNGHAYEELESDNQDLVKLMLLSMTTGAMPDRLRMRMEAGDFTEPPYEAVVKHLGPLKRTHMDTGLDILESALFKPLCQIGASHHITPDDAHGYPEWLVSDGSASFEGSVILQICDKFEAITGGAKGMQRPLNETIKIMVKMAREGTIDPVAFKFFVESGIVLQWAEEEGVKIGFGFPHERLVQEKQRLGAESDTPHADDGDTALEQRAWHSLMQSALNEMVGELAAADPILLPGKRWVHRTAPGPCVDQIEK